MADLTDEEQQFYDRLFPCLRDRKWQYTGAVGYGLVRWWFDLPISNHQEISANAKVGIVQRPNSAYFYVRVDTIDYPQQSFVQRLDLNPENTISTSRRVQYVAEKAAIDLLKEHATEIRQIRQQWIDEVARMKVEGDRS